jgi:hypothetical protein
LTPRRRRAVLLALALGLGWGPSAPLAAWEQLRLPWVFSDEPDLNADFSFAPLEGNRCQVGLDLGGRFAGFGLAKEATRAPKLSIQADFTALAALESVPLRVTGTVDLADVLQEYGVHFKPEYFGAASKFLYKAHLEAQLAPGDYNVSIQIRDPGLHIDSRRTLHLIVPYLDPAHWALGDLKFISALGKRLDEKGREQRVLDPNPWRQVGGDLGWDLLLAYSDRGPRPAGKLRRRHSVRRLRGDAEPIWQEEGDAPAKKASQVWIIRVPEAQLKQWQAGTYVLKAELWAGGTHTEASKSFEVLP